MLNLDWNLLYTVINLVVLYIILKKLFFGSVCKIMDERQMKIQADLDNAAAAKQDAEKIKITYEAELADAHSEAQNIAAVAKTGADRECNAMLEQARIESDRIIREAQKSAQREKQAAIAIEQ